MPMNLVYRALTSDIITKYSFGISTNYMTKEDYNRAYFVTFSKFSELVHLMMHIGWMASLIELLPIAILMRLLPTLGSFSRFREVNFPTEIIE